MTIELQLDDEQAEILLTILWHVGGCDSLGPRRRATEIVNHLFDQGVRPKALPDEAFESIWRRQSMALPNTMAEWRTLCVPDSVAEQDKMFGDMDR